jgi:hypothetical protein
MAAATGTTGTSGTVKLDAKLTGRILLDCVDMPAQTGECALTLALSGGHVAVLASYGKGFRGESSAHDPIVGGTGAYRTARGYTDEVETGDGAMTLTLPPGALNSVISSASRSAGRATRTCANPGSGRASRSARRTPSAPRARP